MEHYNDKILLITTLWLLLLCLNVSNALDCELNFKDPSRVARTIFVHQLGSGNFKTIQSAIDSIPPQNNRWIRILISPGVYREKVRIPPEKPCIFLDGVDRNLTEIQWNDHETTASSATFTFSAVNLMVRGISFKNTYNAPGSVTSRNDIKPALAAFVDGDKAVFHQCGFYGLQDTLWDGPGRHRYTECYIEGVIDVISGTGQSIYEKCVINIPINVYAPILGHGYITAQGKEASSHTNGFVFIECSVIGSGTVYLGRAYRRFSTVIYHKSFLSSCVNPVGWHPWTQVGHEMDFTYVESGCTGPGADISKRVPWIKNLNKYDLRRFIDISFIDQDGWTRKLPQF